MITTNCPFCGLDTVVLAHSSAFAILDRSPVTPGHLLLIPRRHVADWFETNEAERRDLLALADVARTWLIQNYHPDGFN